MEEGRKSDSQQFGVIKRKVLSLNYLEDISTLGWQRDRRSFEKQPSQITVRGAYALSSRPSLVLY